MKKIQTVLIIFFAFCLLPFTLHAQVTLEWVARYGYGPYTATYVDAMALDSLGNIVITGDDNQSPGGFSVAKFNSSGQLVWATRFISIPATPRSIGVDPQGNIYIGANGGGAYILIKYNPAGAQQWWKWSSFSGTSSHSFEDMSLDNNSSGVVVTGYAQFSSGGSTGCLTIKLSQTTGDTVWSRSYNPNPNLSHCLDIDIGDSRIIYIDGIWRPASLTSPDYLILSYGQNGSLRWARTWNGPPGNRWDVAYDVASDRNGNVYVTGYATMDSTTGNEDITTIKYDSSGNQKWVRFYNGPGNITDYGLFIKTDYSGDVIVVGEDIGISTGADFCTIKYDSTGNLIWVRRYNGLANNADRVTDLAVDKFGGVYVTGTTQDVLNRPKITTIKYDRNGNQIWLRKYPDYDTLSAPSAIIVDKNLNVYIGGAISTPGGWKDAIVLKYSQLVGIEPISNEIPNQYKLHQNYPNPFNPTTEIKFSIPQNSFVSLKIYDAVGQLVALLVDNEYRVVGRYSSVFEASNFASGIYFYSLEAGTFKDIKKMVLLK